MFHHVKRGFAKSVLSGSVVGGVVGGVVYALSAGDIVGLIAAGVAGAGAFALVAGTLWAFTLFDAMEKLENL